MDIPPIETLLEPVAERPPCGVDLLSTREWDEIKEARRSEDELAAEEGRERKVADWPLVHELCVDAIQKRSKDLRIAVFLTESWLRENGFSGLRDGARLIRELLVRFSDQGLYPLPEDSMEDRAGPLEWLNDKMADVLATVPLTVRSDGGRNYSFLDLSEARQVGSEKGLIKANGDVDEVKKKRFQKDLKDGKISLDMYNAGVAATRRAPFEAVYNIFQDAASEFKALVKTMDEKFGDFSPPVSLSRGMFEQIQGQLRIILEAKKKEEPDAVPAPAGPAAGGGDAAVPVKPKVPAVRLPFMDGEQGAGGSWAQAEALVRAGQVEEGLSEMARLAATDTSGRNRFLRKLLLAEICVSQDRSRLAQTILEELAEQIDKLNLEAWETPQIVGGVWSRLYRIYRKTEPNADRTLALYKRLSRLDPWQALACSEE